MMQGTYWVPTCHMNAGELHVCATVRHTVCTSDHKTFSATSTWRVKGKGKVIPLQAWCTWHVQDLKCYQVEVKLPQCLLHHCSWSNMRRDEERGTHSQTQHRMDVFEMQLHSPATLSPRKYCLWDQVTLKSDLDSPEKNKIPVCAENWIVISRPSST